MVSSCSSLPLPLARSLDDGQQSLAGTPARALASRGGHSSLDEQEFILRELIKLIRLFTYNLNIILLDSS